MGVFSPCVKGRGQMKNVGDEQNQCNIKATSAKWGGWGRVARRGGRAGLIAAAPPRRAAR